LFLTLLFFHLVAVAMLFSGMALELAMLAALHRAGTVAQVRAAVTNEAFIGPLMGGGALLLMIMGFSMVYAGGFGWQPWVVVAAVVTVALTILGPTINGRRGHAIAAAAAQAPDGPITRELQAARADKVWHYCIVMMACELVAALYLMTNKPSAAFAIGSVVLGALLALVPVARLRRNDAATEAYA